jgi:hypothetical protein
MQQNEYASGESGATLKTSLPYTPASCASDRDCGCWSCLNELAEERNARGWDPQWFGIGVLWNGGGDAG